MSFRRSINRHDEFQQLTQRCQADFEAAGLSHGILPTETALIDFLSTGVVMVADPVSEIHLAELPDEKFARLESAVNTILPTGWHQVSLTAFSRERSRRSGRYA